MPINSKTIDEYLYGSDYVNHHFNKLIKLYGSGTLNQTQISAIRDLFIKMEEVGMLINTPEQKRARWSFCLRLTRISKIAQIQMNP